MGHSYELALFVATICLSAFAAALAKASYDLSKRFHLLHKEKLNELELTIHGRMVKVDFNAIRRGDDVKIEEALTQLNLHKDAEIAA